MELSEDQRAAIRKMARETADDKRDGVLTDFDKMILGRPSVRVNVPLRDTVKLAKHLEVLAAAVERARAVVSYRQKDERATLLAVRGLLRDANQKMNAYRALRWD